MGHHSGSKSSIVPLIDRLNKYPVGLPDSENLRAILRLLFSEEEAYIASRFPLEEATLSELTKATRIPARELQQKLETMADKGLVMDLPYAGQTYYLLMPGLIGFFEFSFMKQREDIPQAEIARLMQDYLHENSHTGGMAGEFFASKTPLTRALVHEDQIPVSSEVTSYQNARQIIEQADFGAVGICYCRHKKHHLNEPCATAVPMEDTCISLGTGARFLVRRGFAKQQSTEQLLNILQNCRQQGLTHITDNIREKPSFICNCCSCCCELLAGVKLGFNEGIAKAPFILQLATERCNGCGRCVAACNVNALVWQGERLPVTLREEVCLGCGACLVACQRGALSLQPRPECDLPPLNRSDMMKRRLLERKRATPFVIGRVKKNLKRVFRKGRRKPEIPGN